MTERTTMILAYLIASPLMYAQTSSGSTPVKEWVQVASVLAMAIASGLAALAQGKAVVGAAEGTWCSHCDSFCSAVGPGAHRIPCTLHPCRCLHCYL